MAIYFYEEEVKALLKNKLALKQFLKALVAEHLPKVKQVNMNYIFCDDAYLLQINQDFLQHDTYTDIITFDLSETEKTLDAEIYVSVERLQENADKFKVTYERELHRVIFHGTLHLCGFKDKKKEEQVIMKQMEDKCLASYFDK